MEELLELESQIDIEIDSLDIQIAAAKSNEDIDKVIYLTGQKQGIATVLEFISNMEE